MHAPGFAQVASACARTHWDRFPTSCRPVRAGLTSATSCCRGYRRARYRTNFVPSLAVSVRAHAQEWRSRSDVAHIDWNRPYRARAVWLIYFLQQPPLASNTNVTASFFSDTQIPLLLARFGDWIIRGMTHVYVIRTWGRTYTCTSLAWA